MTVNSDPNFEEAVEHPAPLTSEDCDLRDYPDMLLDVRRLRDSDLLATEKPEIIVAALMLWCAAWHQLPAASLPDDDRVLAQLAGYGRAVQTFRKYRERVLRGFVSCSDGRFYHPVLAEKAMKALKSKIKFRHERFQDTVRQHNKRDREKNDGRDQLQGLTLDRWLSAGRPSTIEQLRVSLTRDEACTSRGCHA